MHSSTFLLAALSFAAPAFAQLVCTFEYNADATVLAVFPDTSPFDEALYPAFNASFTASDALADIGSTASPGATDPLALVGGEGFPFNGGFRVYACDSTYMGYPATTTGSSGLPVQYGQLVSLTDDANPTNPTCVTLLTVSDGSELWVKEPCSTADDASLLAQFFQFSVVDDGFEAELINVTFLGGPVGDGSARYFLPAGDEYSPLIAKTDPTGYFAQLEYIHIN